MSDLDAKDWDELDHDELVARLAREAATVVRLRDQIDPLRVEVEELRGLRAEYEHRLGVLTTVAGELTEALRATERERDESRAHSEELTEALRATERERDESRARSESSWGRLARFGAERSRKARKFAARWRRRLLPSVGRR